ncbi:MAG TPA: glycosyltransferase family 39 protein [Anaerolineales bacterium]|jgi:4-amino-4-deoxy-L-arabinose transferase-like glycosyltransferase|nr:glycosyltransferase family 39 protein [Anaerolineales bacterium]
MKPSESTLLFTDIRILWLLGLALFLLHMFTNHQYGFHQDELVVLDNARNLDWGFVEYPPLTPFLARIELMLFGLSLVGARTLSALAQSIVLVLTGLMTRELGGRRLTQVVAALGGAIAPIALIQGSLLQYVTFDFLWSVLIAYLVIRLLKSDDPRWWIPIGAVIGLGMMTKYTMAFFVAGLVGAVLLTGARRYLRSPWLWGGVAVSVLLFLPNLIWQIQHGFISLEFLSSIHARDVAIGRADGYIIEQFLFCSNPFMIPFWVAGLIWYFRNEAGKRYRMLGWMYVILFVIYLIAQGRSYYLAPAYPMLIAAGAVVWQGRMDRSSAQTARRMQTVTSLSIVIGAVISGALALPVAPINSPLWHLTSEVHDTFTEQIGWPEMIETVAGIYAGLPEKEKTQTGIFTGENDEAAALNLYGPDYGLPTAMSSSDTFWLRGYVTPPPKTLIVVGYAQEDLDSVFEQCEVAGTITNPYGVENDLRDPPNIFVCRGLRFPLPELWDKVRRFS